MRRLWIASLVISVLLFAPLSFASTSETQDATVEEFLAGFNFQLGPIDLPNGVATLDVPKTFRYIGPDDAKRFLEEGWGNPIGSGTLGMLLPTETDLFNSEGWGVVITYQEDGYVSDKDASRIDYDELLQSMQAATREANKDRQEMGYQPITLMGWAAPPRYDEQAKKLYWAKELKFDDDNDHTLNYNVRILGRKGVLVMNAVSAMSQLPRITERMNQVVAFTEFKEGFRYSDFDPGVDQVAAYGLAALIGGKVAAKAGLLAKLGAMLLAFKKFIFVGLIAAGGIFAKVFKRRQASAAPQLTPEPPEAGA